VVCLGRFSLSANAAICPVRHNQSCAGGGQEGAPRMPAILEAEGDEADPVPRYANKRNRPPSGRQ
jgi:hypothetical protein